MAQTPDAGPAAGSAGAATVASIMQRAPVTTTPVELLSAAQEVMAQRGLHQLPVIEGGHLVGILAERDLHEHTGYLQRTKVDAAMTSNPITVAPDTSAQQAAQLLIEKSINALPVVDGGQLVGIVSRTDLLRLLVGLLDDRRA